MVQGSAATRFGDFPFKLSEYYDSALIEELNERGIFDQETKTGKKVQVKLTGVTRNREGKIIWLEEQDFFHILDRHADRFKIFGLPTNLEGSPNPEDIGKLIFYAITKYPIVSTEEGRSLGSIIYSWAIRRPGGSGYLHVLVDPDGQIVTAYTSKTLKKFG